jgi:hypothetical protein
MNQNNILIVFVLLSLTCSFIIFPASANSVLAQPLLPHEFYGNLDVQGNPGSSGLEIVAVGSGVITGTSGNPITSSAGSYGSAMVMGPKLQVQGDIEPGTPLEFYIAGIKAEVYDVAAGGPWKANYSYTPGKLTELNLRISVVPSAGQTREPTPIQTRLPADKVPAGYVFTGPGLPQPGVVETNIPGQSLGNQSLPGSSPGSDGSGQIPAPGGVQADQTIASVLPVDSSSAGMLIGAGVVIIIVVLGGIFYYMNKKQSGNDKKED